MAQASPHAWRLATKYVSFLIALSALLIGCEQGEVVGMPQELMGIWRTEAARYEDRYLELAPSEVRFGTGGDSFAQHQVAEVRRLDDIDGVAYRITYLSNEGAEHYLSLRYNPDDARLSLVHQPHLVWTRTASFSR